MRISTISYLPSLFVDLRDLKCTKLRYLRFHVEDLTADILDVQEVLYFELVHGQLRHNVVNHKQTNTFIL
jgi:hypothetical protein